MATIVILMSINFSFHFSKKSRIIAIFLLFCVSFFAVFGYFVRSQFEELPEEIRSQYTPVSYGLNLAQ